MNFWKNLFGRGSKPTPAAQVTPQPSSLTPNAAPSLTPPKKPARATDEKSVVAEVKAVLRAASGALNFVARAKQAGFRAVKEDFIGLYLQKGECTLILAVLPSRGPDSIWCLSMIENKGAEIVNLVNEGKFTF